MCRYVLEKGVSLNIFLRPVCELAWLAAGGNWKQRLFIKQLISNLIFVLNLSFFGISYMGETCTYSGMLDNTFTYNNNITMYVALLKKTE